MNYNYMSGYALPRTTYAAPSISSQPNYNYGSSYSAYDYGFKISDLAPPPPPPGEPDESQYSLSRFIPPGKQGTSWTPKVYPGSNPLKRKYTTQKDPAPAEYTSSGQLNMFFGRDQSYPEDLNKLIKPSQCDLCNCQMNSSKSARDHYESKSHDKHLTSWLNKHYGDRQAAVPAVKRFLKAQGLNGPNAYHCDLCDLKLTSLSHANQHYGGKKHRAVMSGAAKPKTSKSIVDKTGRFGIGIKFCKAGETTPDPDIPINKLKPQAVMAINANIQSKQKIASKVTLNSADTTTADKSGGSLDPSLTCSICNVTATSVTQMQVHKQGTKHQKKLAAASGSGSTEPVTLLSTKASTSASAVASAAEKNSNVSEEFANYRTPSGSYYCKTCNIELTHTTILEAHLLGKKHIRKVVDERAEKVSIKMKNE